MAERKKTLLKMLVLVGIFFSLFYNLHFWHYQWLGSVLFLLYLLFVGQWWQEIWRRVFGIKARSLVGRALSWFAVFGLLGFFASVSIVFYKLNTNVILGIFIGTSLISWLICLWLRLSQAGYSISKEEEDKKNFVVFNKNTIIFLLYILLWLAALGLLFFSHSQGASAGFSPWQFINKFFLPTFFVMTVLSGIFLFAKYKVRTLLFILILQSILSHLYLPASHALPWGGDVWRHLAVETEIEAEKPVLPVLIGEEASWREVAGVDLPEVFLTAQKYSYGQLWGTSVLLARVSQIDLLSINRWLVPIIWSVMLPIILFRIGWLLFNFRRKGLWLAWLSFLFFPLQALGGLTLPTSLGLLWFLFVLMLLLQYLNDGVNSQKKLTLFFSLLLLFGYSLYFILIWAVIIIYYLAHIIKHGTTNKFQISDLPAGRQGLRFQIIKKILLICLFLGSISIIPAIELLTKISFIPDKIVWWSNLKQLIGQFSGWFYASAIRPHDILSGNIIFNHTPDYAFVSTIFNSWRWWLLPAMAIFWCLAGLGVYKMIKIRDSNFAYRQAGFRIISLLFSSVFGGYIIGWFVLDGDRLFTRRLDGVLAVLLSILIVCGLQHITFNFGAEIKKYKIKGVILLLVIFLSWFTTFTYASGPDMRVVSVDEYNVASYLWNTDYRSLATDHSCILADTWILLPLEALSSGGIVGGGFPIDYQFGQKERTELLDKFTANPEPGDLVKMKELTGSDKCWFVQNNELLSEEKVNKISQIFNSEPEMANGFLVWYEGVWYEGVEKVEKVR